MAWDFQYVIMCANERTDQRGKKMGVGGEGQLTIKQPDFMNYI